MEIKRVGSQPPAKGPSDWFSGTVRIDPLFQAPDPAIVSGVSVTFEPGARTAWHTHRYRFPRPDPLRRAFFVCTWSEEPKPSLSSFNMSRNSRSPHRGIADHQYAWIPDWDHYDNYPDADDCEPETILWISHAKAIK